MVKKIFAIGGGKEVNIYREMFEFSGVKNPKVLLLPHAVPLNQQQSNYDRMYNIFVHRFDCHLKLLKSNQLANLKTIKEELSLADIIYVSEGDTPQMIHMWKNYGFDKLLKEQWEKGKLMCGTSAGALCWFNSFTTSNQDQTLRSAEGLNFVDAYLTVHGQETNTLEFSKQAIAKNNKLGILLTNGSALEIEDDKWRFIINKNDTYFSYDYKNNEPYAIVSYYDNDKCWEEKFDSTTNIKDIDKLLVKKL